MKYDLITIGDAVEDVFVIPELDVKYERVLPSHRGIVFEFGEKIPLNAVKYEIGGSACNAAVGFSRLGYKCGIVTAMGTDSPAERVVERLKEESVDFSSSVISSKLQTGFSVIFSIDGDRTIFVFHGLKDYSKLKIKKSLNSDWYFLTALGEGSDKVENHLISEVSEKGSKLAWNPGSIQISQGATKFRHLLRTTSVLFLNREEAIKFSGLSPNPRIEEVMKKLAIFGPKIVVVTNGKAGAKVWDGMKMYEATANLRTQRVDATGAGDSFAVGFLGRLMQEDWKSPILGEAIKEALAWGMKNSDSVIRHIGAQKGLLNKKEIQS